ncbi:hypothetical protein B9Q02_08365 [Candidatus Marsarchaeota G1 archaeon BE_D]|jgi:ABC-type branched-chain amino acid transport systems, ATPase component|uniref:ABC transporter domain-containing protein n=1 Tax=Candidatus Marsarchaeota G1 archaeon BE_D TaxID=1978156 RepID=A0A2R6AEX0_9ARCH|nr:MAG: hypothetical protein B9Q02_08365 [Candidatus Marsarchaeota G1 archaeon BE_D]
MSVILSVNGVFKRFQGVIALNDVTLNFEEGKIYGLIGPNGSGKTTLINVISGFVKPDMGDVFYKGLKITKLKPYQRAQMGIARTFQIPRIFSSLTIEENIKAVIQSDSSFIEGVLSDFGLNNIKHKIASTLGYAEKKIVELARTMALNPSFVMLDEPLAGLDNKGIERMLYHIKNLNRNFKKTFLITEHNLDELMSIADHVIVLNQGRVLEQGEPDKIKESQLVHEVYFAK